MTTVVYEPTLKGLAIHITRNGEKTVCKKPIKSMNGMRKNWSDKEIYCKTCWIPFNG